jgi:hypothetical protein
MEVLLDGAIKLFILDVISGNPLNETKSGREIEVGVFDDIEMGNYIIGLRDRTICSIDDLETVLYKFDFEVVDMEYNFY